MDLFSTLLAFLLLSSAVVEASNIALSSQLYWHTILPNTPMPKAIRDLLHSDVENEKTVDPVPFVLDGIPDNQFVITRYYMYSEPVSADALANNPVATLFFLEKDLHSGAKMTLHFKSSFFKAAFLPRRMAESIPFSSEHLPEILQYFSINPTSIESESVANNLQMCEKPEIHKEHKHCATSLESMVDFSTSNLGTLDLSVLSTKVGSEGRAKQEYTIAPSGVRKMAGLDLVGCHILAHPYAVFFCHSTRKARAYAVQMKGADGAVVEAAAVCHVDTSDWNPSYLAFQVLKVSPGPPVCHFLPSDHVVWAHSN